MSAPAEDRFNDVGTVEASGGSWAGNSRITNGFLVGVRVKPDTASTLYDLTVLDRDGFTVFQRLSIKGELVEHWFKIPMRAGVTVQIDNSTVADEGFTLKLLWEHG